MLVNIFNPANICVLNKKVPLQKNQTYDFKIKQLIYNE